jgi:hypothetical protein
MEQGRSSEADKSLSWARNCPPFMEPEAVLAACLMLVSCSTYSLTLNTEAICSSEIFADFHRTTRYCIPEDRTLHVLNFILLLSWSNPLHEVELRLYKISQKGHMKKRWMIFNTDIIYIILTSWYGMQLRNSTTIFFLLTSTILMYCSINV